LFTIERFIEECRAAVAAPDAAQVALALVEQAVSDPGRLAMVLAAPVHAGLEVLHRAADLTVIDFAWAPWMCFKPHNHCMWSVVGIYSGREDNVFWKRTRNGIEARSARSIGLGEAALLGQDVIHSVVNPIGKLTRAVHVYGGDFFAPLRPRSEWEPESLAERPWDMDDTRRLFAEAEERARR
jgi:predicted metal-dependent enzyme (double-stranded beta helix superfamily)